MNPVAVAITGFAPRKKDNLAVPTTPAEQVESTQAAYEAGVRPNPQRRAPCWPPRHHIGRLPTPPDHDDLLCA